MALTNVDRLTESPGELKRRPDGARYHDGETIITHLNYALEPWGWDWSELDSGTDPDTDEVWVLGQLVARFVVAGPDGEQVVTTTKIERGWQKINRLRDGAPKSPGDDRKGAATDALKRCARLLGVGLDAWAKSTPGPVRSSAPGSSLDDDRQADRPLPVAQASLSPSERERRTAEYLDLLARAKDRDFRASWTSQDPSRWSDVQLMKYADVLTAYLARHQGAA
jgi:hypothetical protein